MPEYTPTLDPTLLLEGPAHILISKPATKADWKYCWCAGTVTVNLMHSSKEMPVSGFGMIDDPRKDEYIEVDFTPAGNMDADQFAFLFSGVFGLIGGKSIFPSADTPCWIHTLDGQLLGLTRARVYQFPTLRFGAGIARVEGSAKIIGVIGKGLARSAANSLFTPFAAEEFTAVPDPDDWNHLPCHATWAALAGLDIMTDEKGWTLRAASQISPRYNPDVGTFDFRVDEAALEVSCRPININDATLISATLIGADRRIGVRSVNGTLTLAEDHPGITAVLNGARLTAKPMVYGGKEPRAGELTWRAYPVGGTLGSVGIASGAEA